MMKLGKRATMGLPFALALQDRGSGRIAVPVPLPLINKPVVYLLQLQACFLDQSCLVFLLKSYQVTLLLRKRQPHGLCLDDGFKEGNANGIKRTGKRNK